VRLEKTFLMQKKVDAHRSARYTAADMSNETHTKRRGRPAGSTSFVRVKLSDLIAAVGVNANIVVSKKWLEEIGLTTETPALTILPQAAPAVEMEKIQFSFAPFSDDEDEDEEFQKELDEVDLEKAMSRSSN
jgi:hypothetical protein